MIHQRGRLIALCFCVTLTSATKKVTPRKKIGYIIFKILIKKPHLAREPCSATIERVKRSHPN